MIPSNAKAEIAAVLEGEDFHDMLEIRIPQFDYQRLADSWLFEWLTRLFNGLGETSRGLSFVEVLLWLLFVSLLLLLVFKFRAWLLRFLPRSVGTASAEADPVKELFGMDIRADSLPSDVPLAARELWQQGQRRSAVALLYRASLSRLVERFGCQFREGDTERQCLAQVRELNREALYSGFARLSSAWQYTAYGSIPPSDSSFSALCTDWAEHFQGENQGRVFPESGQDGNSNQPNARPGKSQ